MPLNKKLALRAPTVMALGGICVISLWSLTCGSSRRVVISSKASPTGRHVAYLERVEKGGGATVGFVYQVVVVPSATPFDKDRDDTWIWSAYSTFPTSYEWRNGFTVRVTLSKSRNPSMESVRTRRRYGVAADVVLTE